MLQKLKELVLTNPNVKNLMISTLSLRKLSVDGVTIDQSSSIKYLGVKIDSNLNFDEQIDSVNRKCISLSYYAGKILRSCSSIHVVRDFVDVCILPYLYYALPSYVGFLNVDSVIFIRRLLRRLAVITGRNKEEYCIISFLNDFKILLESVY